MSKEREKRSKNYSIPHPVSGIYRRLRRVAEPETIEECPRDTGSLENKSERCNATLSMSRQFRLENGRNVINPGWLRPHTHTPPEKSYINFTTKETFPHLPTRLQFNKFSRSCLSNLILLFFPLNRLLR